MTYFRFRWQLLGGHVHVRVFSGKNLNGALGKNGDLVFTEDEWPAFRAFLERGHIRASDDFRIILKEEDPWAG